MSVEEQLKQLILSNYKSVRAFTLETQLPYSTVDNIFKRGIGGTAVTTVVKICDALNITVEGITRGHIEPRNSSVLSPSLLTLQQSALLSSFDQLNEEGQTKAVEYVEDLVLTGRYKNVLRLSWAQKKRKK